MTVRFSDPPARGLYAITPEHTGGPADLVRQVEQAILGGACWVQYRDKSQNSTRRHETALALAALCRLHRVLLIINDDVELAAAVAADGVHLGRDDEDPRQARERLGSTALIGVSCYNRLENARRAAARGADYLAFGRFFPSATKPGAVPADPALLAAARRHFSRPLVAIGGISPENGAALIRAGADLLAAVDAVFHRPDITGASRAFADLFAAIPPKPDHP
jgi:thiamine-phosphate pyrophosphorylase